MSSGFQRDIVVEFAPGGFWVDITTDVFDDDGVSISRGRSTGEGQVPPSSCSFTLTDRDGKYDSRNPVGPYFGLFGRNTPVRVALRLAKATFAQSASSAWPTADTGQVWTNTGAGGTVQASDFNASGGVATHSVPATNAHRRSTLAAVSQRDVGVLVTATVPFTNVTGAPIEVANVILRGTATPDYYYAKVTIETDESIKVGFATHSGLTIAAAVTVPGLTHSTSQPIRVFAEAEGHTLRAKVWQPNLTGEPDTWHLTVHDETLTGAGYVGVRTGVQTGNTNTLPIVISYDDFELRSPRFWGEVPMWPTRWDTALDGKTRIDAAGILRRLGQGKPPEWSVLYQAITTLATNKPVAYWPCEDGRNSTVLASGLPMGLPMAITGTPSFGAETGFVASAALPQLAGSRWNGLVRGYTSAGTEQVRFLMHFPAGGATDGTQIISLTTNGTAKFWGLHYLTGGGLKVTASNAQDVNILDSGALGSGANVNGRFLRVSFELVNTGSDVNWSISLIEPGVNASYGFVSTLAGFNIGAITQVVVNQSGNLSDVGLGHITVQAATDGFFTLYNQLAAYTGEKTGDRAKRICGENGIGFANIGDTAATAMGPQLAASPLALVQEAVDANHGILSESRGALGLEMRMLSSLYNQTPTATLDYAGNDLAPPFAPLPDDLATRNDITASRTNGSSARYRVDTGPLSIQSPPNGVGPYPDPVTLNLQSDDQLLDHAAWLAHLGTVDEARYPQISLDLAGSTVGDKALDLNIGDRLTLTHLSSFNIFDDPSQLIVGYRERISTFSHTMDVNCTPESPYRVFVLDDGTFGRLDSDTSTLNSGVNSSATSLSVAVADGTLWTTDAAEWPFPIVVAGEEMSVTAVSGSSSPQTFTVTRSVNGVVKSQSAGAKVQLARSAVLAL